MLTNEQKKVFKIIIGVLMFITLALGVEYLIEYFMNSDAMNNMSFFATHFTFGICLILIGIIAFLLPFQTRTRFGEGKGDNMMLIVGILLVLCGIIAIPITFLF